MSVYKKEFDYSPELHEQIVRDICRAEDRTCIEKILKLFLDAGLTIRVKQLFPDTPNMYYRILCFIKKSAEAVIVNTREDLGKEGVRDGVSIQIRILNQGTLDNLEQFSEGIRSQVVGAGDCRFCSDKCAGKRYEFVYAGKSYTKCQYLCSNFRLLIQDERAIDDIVRIIENELSRSKEKKKKAP